MAGIHGYDSEANSLSIEENAKVLNFHRGFLQRLQISARNLNTANDAFITANQEISELVKDYSENIDVAAAEDETSLVLGGMLKQIVLMQKTYDDMHAAIKHSYAELDLRIGSFLKCETQAAESQKKDYEKSSSSFQTATAKYQTTLMKSKGMDAKKKFEMEQEHNVLKKKCEFTRISTKMIHADALEKNAYDNLETLASLYKETNKICATQVENSIAPEMEQYTSKFEEYSRARALCDYGIVKEGIMERRGKRKWNPTYCVLKYKYLYCYTDVSQTKLVEVIPLVKCSVARYPRKVNSLVINTSIESIFFRCKTKESYETWLSKTLTCLVSPETYATREVGKFAGKVKENKEDTQADLKQKIMEDNLRKEKDVEKLLAYTFMKQEKKFVANLTRVVESYKKPVLTAISEGLLKDPNVQPELMFGIVVDGVNADIEEILKIHEDMLEKFRFFWERNTLAGITEEIFAKIETFSKIYIPYVRNLSHAVYQIKKVYKHDRSTTKFINNLEQSSGIDKEFMVLLHSPIQRIPQYITYLQQRLNILDSLGKNSALDQETLREMEKFKENLRESNKQSHAIGILLSIRRELDLSDLTNFEFIDHNRRLLVDGPLQVKMPAHSRSRIALLSNKFQQMYVYLFNDVIIFTKTTSGIGGSGIGKNKYKVLAKAYMINVDVSNIPDSLQFSVLEGANKKRGAQNSANAVLYTLQAASKEEKTKWVKSLIESIEEMHQQRRVYAVPLDVLMSGKRSEGRTIPLIIDQLCSWIEDNALEVEGIFRKPGSLDTVHKLKKLYNNGEIVTLPENSEYYTVCSLLQHWLMELPEPLLTVALYPDFIRLSELVAQRDPQVLAHLKATLDNLPMYNGFVLHRLITMLIRVTEKAEINKMTISNCGIVFGPSILGDGGIGNLLDVQSSALVVELMIKGFNSAFTGILARKEAEENQIRDSNKKRWDRRNKMNGDSIYAEAQSYAAKELAAVDSMDSSAFDWQAAVPAGTPIGTTELNASGPTEQRTPPARPTRSALGASNGTTPPAQAEAPLNKTGWLGKKGGQRRNWKTRFFVLRQGYLYYYKDQKDNKPLGSIPLRSSNVTASGHKDYCISIATASRTYLLTGKDAQEQREWVASLRRHC